MSSACILQEPPRSETTASNTENMEAFTSLRELWSSVKYTFNKTSSSTEVEIFPEDDDSGSESSDTSSTESGADTPPSTISDASADGWDSHGAADWEEHFIVHPTLSFSDPLPSSIGSLEIDGVDIPRAHFPFLVRFFARQRHFDLPFSVAHRFIGFVAQLCSEAAFAFLSRCHQDALLIKSRLRENADDAELQDMVQQIINLSLHDAVHDKLAVMGIWNNLEDLRNHAIHSWTYDSDQIRAAVGFLAMVKDAPSLSALERVLQTIYTAHSDIGCLTFQEKAVFDVALGYFPWEPETLSALLRQVQDDLETSCWEYWSEHDPQTLATFSRHRADMDDAYSQLGSKKVGWDCPERGELHRYYELEKSPQVKYLDWDFPQFPIREKIYNPDQVDRTYLERKVQSGLHLRNQASHPNVREDGFLPPTVYELLTNAADLAKLLDNEAVAQRIHILMKKDLLKPVFAKQAELTAERMATREAEKEHARGNWREYLLEDSMHLRSNGAPLEGAMGDEESSTD